MGPVETLPGGEGRTIAFSRGGTGRTVVLLHGIGESHASFAPISADLQRDHDVIAVDLAGHGAASAPKAADLAAMVGDVGALIAALKLDKPLLVGHSLGGAVASLAAASVPIRGAIVIDQPLALAGFREALAPMKDALFTGDYKTAVEGMMGAMGFGQLPEALQGPILASRDRTPRETYLAIWAGLFDDEGFAATEALVDSVLKGITVPYLALVAEGAAPGYGDWLKARMPHAITEEWPGGHWLHLADQARFTARVRAFDALPPKRGILSLFKKG
ncbi:MAG: alpha/beta fold hydrolase [Alphaproteobacteria bacterium]|nr:alpha/beta fold hydrolase [Alphaproteobacteria bacterium]